MQKTKYELSREVEELLRCAVAPLNAGYAVGCFVITSAPALTEVAEVQLFLGWGNPAQEFAKELERQLSAGRIVLALCPMLSIGRGQVHLEICIAQAEHGCAKASDPGKWKLSFGRCRKRGAIPQWTVPTRSSINFTSWSPKALAIRTSIPNTGAHTLTNQVAFQLRHGSNDSEQRLTERAGSV